VGIGQAGVTFTGLAVGVGLVACGGGGRPIVEDDLPQVVLQREDVEIGVMTESTAQPDSASAAYAHQFEVPAENVGPGDIACITGGAALYDSLEQAEEAFDETLTSFNDLKDDPVASGAGIELAQLTVPEIGDRTVGFRLRSSTAVFCSDYENEPIDQHIVVFQQNNVLSNVSVINFESGASLEEAIELAKKQETRIDQVQN